MKGIFDLITDWDPAMTLNLFMILGMGFIVWKLIQVLIKSNKENSEALAKMAKHIDSQTKELRKTMDISTAAQIENTNKLMYAVERSLDIHSVKIDKLETRMRSAEASLYGKEYTQ